MKKLVPLVLAVFLIYLIVQSPATAADLSRDGAAKGWDLVTQVFDSFISFLQQLF